MAMLGASCTATRMKSFLEGHFWVFDEGPAPPLSDRAFEDDSFYGSEVFYLWVFMT